MTSVTSLGSLVVHLVGDASQYHRVMRGVEASMSATMERLGRIIKRGVTVASLALLGLAAISTRAATKFESSFAGVIKTVNATEAEFAQLRKEFRQMALDIPVNVNEINRIGEAAGQLGIQTKNITQFTRVMADLGVTTNMSSDEAATALARLANITQMPQEEFDRLGSTIVELGNNLATTEGEIVEMGLRLAGAGAQIGLTEAEILALAGALSSVGIRAEAGGTAISRVMVEMAKAVKNGGQELRVFSSVAGETGDQFVQSFEEDAAGAVVAFVEGLGKLSDEGHNVFGILEQLGFDNVRVRDALLRSAGAGDLMRQSLKLGSEAWEENTALTEEAEKRYGTFASQLTKLVNKFNDLAITIGDTLIPVLKVMNNDLQAMLGKDGTAQGARDLANFIQKAIITMVAGVSDIAFGLGLLVKVFRQGFAELFSFINNSAIKAIDGMVGLINTAIDAANQLIVLRNLVTPGALFDTPTIPNVKPPAMVDTRLWAAAAKKSAEDFSDDFWEDIAKGRPWTNMWEKFNLAIEEAQREVGPPDVGEQVAKPMIEDIAKAIVGGGKAPRVVIDALHDVQKEVSGFNALFRDESFTEVLKGVVGINKAFEEGILTIEEYTTALNRIIGEGSPFISKFGRGDLLQLTGIPEVDQLNFMESQFLEIQDLYKQHRQAILDIDKISEEQRLRLLDEADRTYLSMMEEFNRQRTSLVLNSMEGSLGEMAEVMREGFGEQSGIYKAMFAASKAFAIADATIKIQQGIAAASSLPFPANLAAIAATISATASLISNIQAVALSFEGGGWTGDGPRSGGMDGKGGFLAVMHPRERVIDTVASSGGGDQPVIVNLTYQIESGVTRRDLAPILDQNNRRVKSDIITAINRGGAPRTAFTGRGR